MIHSLLSQFCLASGLRINVAKSRAFVGAGVGRARKARIFSITEIPFTAHLVILTLLLIGLVASLQLGRGSFSIKLLRSLWLSQF